MRSTIQSLIKNKTPVPYVSNSYLGLSQYSTGNATEAYLYAYQRSGSLFANVSLLTENTAFPDWRMYRVNTDARVRYTTADLGTDTRTEVVQHQALKVLNNPNPFFSRFDLFELSQTYLELAGESWWIIDRDNAARIPTAIWPVRPDRMDPIPDRNNYVSGYQYSGPDGEKILFAVDEVVFVKYPNPVNPYRGQSPVQTILSDIEGGRFASEWNRNFFYNEAEPGGIIQTNEKMSDEEINEFTNRWRETHRGVSRAHRVSILENMVWVPNEKTQKDMDFVNLRLQSRDFIHEAYRTHKVMIGISDDVNRANAQTGEEVFNAWQITPKLNRWKMALNKQFLPMFGSTGQGVEFDFVPPVSNNREQTNAELQTKSAAFVALINAGADPAYAAEFIGMPSPKMTPVKPAPAMPPDQESDNNSGDDGDSDESN